MNSANRSNRSKTSEQISVAVFFPMRSQPRHFLNKLMAIISGLNGWDFDFAEKSTGLLAAHQLNPLSPLFFERPFDKTEFRDATAQVKAAIGDRKIRCSKGLSKTCCPPEVKIDRPRRMRVARSTIGSNDDYSGETNCARLPTGFFPSSAIEEAGIFRSNASIS